MLIINVVICVVEMVSVVVNIIAMVLGHVVGVTEKERHQCKVILSNV